MKKALSFLLCWVLLSSLSAQIQRGIKGAYVVDSFPTVSFTWNSPNPEILDASHFILLEGDSSVDFKLNVLPQDPNKTIEKSILFLWEDMASHNRQSDFTRELLIRFFSETEFASEDYFEVAVFDRLKNTDNIIKPLIGKFTNNSKRITDVLSNYQKNNSHYTAFPLQSDLYLAINEGINLLRKEPATRTGVIIVVTAGLNVKAAGASTEMETIRKNAREAGIPIYVVKYPIAGDTPEINMLAESTFGLSFSSTDIPEALNKLQKMYGELTKRISGQDYRFSFVANGERDGKPHPMKIMIDKVRRPLPPYIAPTATFSMKMKENWLLVTILVLLIIGISVLVIMLIHRKNKKREKSAQEMQEQMRLEHEESERRNREAVETMRREHEAKEQAAQEAIEREKRAAEAEKLSNLMYTKNLFPRLQCIAGSDTFTYTIRKARTTLGRNEDNDVAFSKKNDSFDNMTVSGVHAEIIFNGSTFDIFNRSLSYTKGIIVNGNFYQQYSLNNGDMIGLGEAVITFYI